MKSNVLPFPSTPITPKVKPSPARIDAHGHRERVRGRRDALVAEHLPLVRQIAQSVARSLPPSFDLDDLIAEGNLALLGCATRFRPDAHGNPPFAAFARNRIRGAIIDKVRRRHYLENTRPSIEQHYGVIAGQTRDYGRRAKQRADDPIRELAISSAPSVEVTIDQARQKKRVREAIEFLPPDQRELIVNRYLEERRGKGVTADLASETHVIAIDALRKRLKTAA